jgi:hypothetical protein
MDPVGIGRGGILDANGEDGASVLLLAKCRPIGLRRPGDKWSNFHVPNAPRMAVEARVTKASKSETMPTLPQ